MCLVREQCFGFHLVDVILVVGGARFVFGDWYACCWFVDLDRFVVYEQRSRWL